MVCIGFDSAGILVELERAIGPAVIIDEVSEEWHGTTVVEGAVDVAPWIDVLDTHPDDLAIVAGLLRSWGSEPGKDRGEAASIAACDRHGWILVCEDTTGRAAAKLKGVPTVFIVTALAAAAACDRIPPTEAWRAHCAVESARQRTSRQGGRFSALPADNGFRATFMRVHAAFRRLWIDKGRPDWPELLSQPGLDDAVIQARRQTASER
jgi:predicted nucleic acid-binding protein